MQILLTHGEVGEAVKNLIAERVSLAEGETIQVYLTDDGATVSILPEGDQPEAEETSTQPAGERPAKRQRRSKAQIEADNKAEAERLAAAQESAASGNDVASTVKPDAETPVVEPEAAGETTQEQSAPGTEARVTELKEEIAQDLAEDETPVDPNPVVGTSVAVDAPEVVTEAAAVKPTGTSLFQNLRRPVNT